MGLLGATRLGGVDVGLGRHTLGAVLLSNKRTRFFLGFTGHVDTIGTHVGNQTNRAFVADVNPFVELLRQRHGLLARKTQFA